MAQSPRRPPRRRKKKEPLVILLVALVVAAVTWPFEKLRGHGEHRVRPERGPHRRRRRTVVLIAAGVVVLALVVTLAAAASGSDTIHSNVTVHGIDVGGLTVDQAALKLARVAPRGGAVTLTWNGHRSTLSAAALHARIAAVSTARAAYRYTRRGNLLARSWTRFWLVLGRHDIAPRVVLAQPRTAERLAAIARGVDVKPVPGTVTVTGAQPVVRQARNGRAVDRAAVLRLFESAVVSGHHVTAALPVITVAPQVSTADARTAAATALAWLTGPLALTHGGHTWTISRQDLGQYLAFVPQKGSPRLRVTFDSPVTRGYFDFITQQVGKPGKNASFTTSANGRHVKVRSGTSGYGVVPRPTIANMEAAAAADGRRRAVAVFGKAPPVLSYADARAMDITRRIGTYTTSVAGTSNRLTNVGLGAALLNNSLIGPGKIFSVNATTGERTAAKGFKMAPTIINGKLGDSVGGGMCQVSTTVFNAAFEAGLQIVERHNHELYISHYPLARDATVSYGSYDLKFRNDTPHWILLKTTFTGWSLTVSLYSAPLHRKVVASTSAWYGFVAFTIHKQDDPTLAKGKSKIDTPGVGGMSIDCFRKVYDPDGKLIWNDDFKSVYSMVPEVLLVGTKVAKPTVSPSPSGSSSPKATPKPSPSATH
jgi:vancomycin resistance protein YoaR